MSECVNNGNKKHKIFPNFYCHGRLAVWCISILSKFHTVNTVENVHYQSCDSLIWSYEHSIMIWHLTDTKTFSFSDISHMSLCYKTLRESTVVPKCNNYQQYFSPPRKSSHATVYSHHDHLLSLGLINSGKTYSMRYFPAHVCMQIYTHCATGSICMASCRCWHFIGQIPHNGLMQSADHKIIEDEKGIITQFVFIIFV